MSGLAAALGNSSYIKQTMATNEKFPRLLLPSACLLLYWLAGYVAGLIDKPYFVGFFFGLGTAAVLTLVLLGWWWFNRDLNGREKALGSGLLLGEAFVVGKFSHRSVNFFTLWTVGFPLVVAIVVAGMFFLKRSKTPLGWLTLGVLVTLTWSGFLLVRFDSAYASLSIQRHWRWTATPEEEFVAQSKPVPARAPLPAKSAVVVADPSRGDWTSFRGVGRDGVIRGTSITTNWSSPAPVPVWKRPVGPSWSSLLVIGNRLYTQEQRAEREMVVCYDTETGEQVWAHEDITRFDESVSGPGPRATPTFANGHIYALGGTGLLNCLDAATGTVIWKTDIKDASDAKVPTWAFASSPLVADGLVVVYAGGDAGKGLLAYREASGAVVWSAPAGASSYSSPQLASLCGAPQCLMLHDGGMTAVDLATGKKLWETGQPMKGSPRTAQPRLIAGNKLMVASLNGMGCSLIDVSKKGDQWVVANGWESKAIKPEFPDFVVHKGYAYGFDMGLFCCVNLTDGQRCWKDGRYGRGEVMLLADQDLLLVSTETGELVLLAADPAAHRELGRFQAVEGKTWNHPVVRGSRVCLRNAQEMACYNLPANR